MEDKKNYSVIILWIAICAMIGIAIPSLLTRKHYAKLVQTPYPSFPEPSLLPIYTKVQTIRVELFQLRAIAKGKDDTFLVGGDNMFIKYDMAGKELWRCKTDEEIQCMATHMDGTVFVGYKNRVVIFTDEGHFVSEMPELGEKAYLTSLAVSSNDVFAADYGNRVVWRFDKTGKLLGNINGVTDASPRGFILPSPYFDVAIASDGNIWIVNTGLLRLQKHASDGTFIRTWGKASPNIEDFCGCCNPAHISVGVDGVVITSEKGIARIKAYDDSGRLIGIVISGDDKLSGITGTDLVVDSSGRILVLDAQICAVHIFVRKQDIKEK